MFAPETRKWWTLAAVSFGLFMIMLDNTVVNVALPSIQKGLGISVSELEWVVNAYALTFGVLLLSGGKLADLFGRRFIFIVGLLIFTGASLWCGLAGHAGVAARKLPYGHRRLLEIARAFVAEPALLLLDEPAAGLNQTEAANLSRLIGRIRDAGCTVVLVEHHMDVVMSVCDVVTVLNYGRKLAEGGPAEIQGHAQVIEAYLGRGDLPPAASTRAVA